uniref:Uncharacterized protein n=1 Tax=Romanomermis culicivorax TaxID=13658 RepID=A0A915KMZ1_ROMCU
RTLLAGLQTGSNFKNPDRSRPAFKKVVSVAVGIYFHDIIMIKFHSQLYELIDRIEEKQC